MFSGRWRHLLALLTCAAAVLLLAAGCGSSGSDSSAAAGGKTSSEGCEQVTLNLLTGTGEGEEPFSPEVMKAWQASHPCTTVKFSYVPFGQLGEKITVLAASENPPDIYSYDGPDTQTYAYEGIIQPMTEAIPNSYQEDLLPADKEMLSYEGQLYSPGLGEAVMGLFYNQDLLKKAGVTPPQGLEETWTWPEALRAFEQCQQGPAGHPTVWGLAPSELGNGTPGFSYRDLQFARSAGDPNAPEESSSYKTFYGLAPDGTTAEGWLNTPEAVEADQFYQDLFNKDGVVSKAGIPNLFLDGKACFNLVPSWYMGALEEAKVKFKWGVTGTPYFMTPIVHMGSTALGVSAKTQHLEQADEFIMYISSKKEQIRRLEDGYAGNWFPVLTSLYSSPLLQQEPLKLFIQELEQWSQPRALTPYYVQYDDAVTKALDDIALGGNVEESLDNAVETFESSIQR
jgi:ABC-type glycerol-3-phosphate transport system substrate-binding protein